jgi:hypothetical protein
VSARRSMLLPQGTPSAERFVLPASVPHHPPGRARRRARLTFIPAGSAGPRDAPTGSGWNHQSESPRAAPNVAAGPGSFGSAWLASCGRPKPAAQENNQHLYKRPGLARKWARTKGAPLPSLSQWSGPLPPSRDGHNNDGPVAGFVRPGLNVASN